MKNQQIPTRYLNLVVTFSFVVVIVLFASSRAAFAFEDCQKVKATEVAGFTSPTTVEGKVSQGGILNGTSLSILTSAFMPTPDPSVFSFTIAKSFTTERGVLQTYSPHLLDYATGTGTAFARIDPNTSTGVFAGATGLLYVNFYANSDGVTSTSEVSGKICFAS